MMTRTRESRILRNRGRSPSLMAAIRVAVLSAVSKYAVMIDSGSYKPSNKRTMHGISNTLAAVTGGIIGGT